MCAWQAVADIGIAKNCARNATAVQIAQKHIAKGDQVLILVNKVEHGEVLASAIGPEALCVHSGVGAKKRREAMEAINSGKLRCMVATSIGDEGLNLPSLNVLILVSGGRSQIKAEQRTGRVLRAFGEKTHGIIYDFKDEAHHTMANQSRKRVAVYKKLGYEICNH
jgi:superfamily II DNA or RNA helicase